MAHKETVGAAHSLETPLSLQTGIPRLEGRGHARAESQLPVRLTKARRSQPFLSPVLTAGEHRELGFDLVHHQGHHRHTPDVDRDFRSSGPSPPWLVPACPTPSLALSIFLRVLSQSLRREAWPCLQGFPRVAGMGMKAPSPFTG